MMTTVDEAEEDDNNLWYNDVQTVKKMMIGVDSSIPRCPSCHMPFDKGKKRRLIDNCGHERCYSCIFNSDQCPLCALEAPIGSHCQEVPNDETVINQPCIPVRPRLKTNGHFTTFMQTRCDSGKPSLFVKDASNFEGPGVPKYIPSLDVSRVPWHQKHKGRSTKINADVHNPLSDDDNLPYTAKGNDETAKKDLFIRFGLLPGDSPQIGRNAQPPRPGSTNHSSHESYASISSLASSEANIAGSTDTSPVSTLTGSSEAEVLSSLVVYRTSSRDPSSDSVGSLMSTSTCNSTSPIPISAILHRQLSGRARENNPFSRRTSAVRRSDKNVKSTTALDIRGHNHGYKGLQVTLQPLFFEVPQSEPEPIFIGRHWLLKEIEQVISSNSSGIVISGGPGSGKTAIALQLVDHSVFGPKREEPIYHDILSSDSSDYMSVGSGGSSYLYQSRLSLTQETARSLGGHVVAYHFCQVDNNVTCLVPDFVHSIAAQLCHAPQLVAYREFLVQEPRYQQLLSMTSCITNASEAFVRGVLEPLNTLRRFGKIPNTTCLLVVDGLNEAEFHKPDYGDTIASFLSRHTSQFPSWLKVIITVRTAFQEVTKLLPFHRICLDKLSANDNLKRDVYDYIMYRLGSSHSIRENITINKGQGEAASHTRFANHLVSLSKGCVLYIKLILDLIERGHLVVKSSSYKVIPVSLSEVYLLSFNLKFTTIKAFERVSSLLQVSLATLFPLKPIELFHSVNAAVIDQPLTWEEFCQKLDVLITSQFLVLRQDHSLMFSHPSLREWLMRREENESLKFLCDVKNGHAMISLRLSRLEVPLSPELCLELGHHMLMAHIYKSTVRDILAPELTPRDLQAYWIQQSTNDITAALTSVRNVYSPNVKVSRLLLLAKANPRGRTNHMGNAPLLVVAAYEGILEMVSMLLEFGADPSDTNDFGQDALCLASQKGHLEIICLLLTRGAKINQTDKGGQCSLVYAASHGHLEVVSYLVQCDWPLDSTKGPSLAQAAQQSLVSGAFSGHSAVCEFLLDMAEVKINNSDDVTGHTPLTAACLAGHKEVCDTLLRRGAIVSVLNQLGEPPLTCAVAEGHWEIAELLLSHKATLEQTDSTGKTSLMLAAVEGHLGLLELLLAKGANPDSTDKDGMTALSWASIKGQLQAIQCLLNHGTNINHADKNGRTPLDLAAYNGDPNIVKLLMDQGAVVEHVDLSGMRPLDRAISCKNLAAVSCFLQRGAKIGPQTWAMTEGKPDVLLLLLKKLHEDGTTLYKKGRLKEAAHRFQYALKKCPGEDTMKDHLLVFQQVKFHLYVFLSKCKRKMNEFDAAIEAADQAIFLKPKSVDGYFTRARAKHEAGHSESALQDITEALRFTSLNQEARKILLRFQEEINSGHKEESPSPSHGGEEASNPTDKVSCQPERNLAELKTLSVSTDTIDQLYGLIMGPSNFNQRELKTPADQKRYGFETAI
ncbi:protein TANC2-like isoform X1 [Limulus polyphemus]|uniref:Protein TANC2-like isoform X1 n=1 Tax=Limulus polyphemus TaxID=6850 RepID=A0ABM1S1I3_LIMPO|nr:protein TANC2-like isoform X1 [Limulus polyphemus]